MAFKCGIPLKMSSICPPAAEKGILVGHAVVSVILLNSVEDLQSITRHLQGQRLYLQKLWGDFLGVDIGCVSGACA